MARHVDWAKVPRWLNVVLGDSWELEESGQFLALDCNATALWSLANSAGTDERIRVEVMVQSGVASDGSFDFEASVKATEDAVVMHVLYGDINPTRDLWVRGELDDLGDYSLQSPPDSDTKDWSERCVVVVAANAVVKFTSSGMTNAALRNVARKLLEYTVRRNGEPSLAFPSVTSRAALASSGDASTPGVVQVKGVYTEFTVSFSVEREICAAGAACQDNGIVFHRPLIHPQDSNAPTSGYLVDFVFSTSTLGRHGVRMRFVDALTMVCVSKDLMVDVIM
ncbi:hypothetical protein LXA43DRAFT_983447 [Ganoderma leucocontextum]|nr:hypothetical protein LXA43DRAFT_983447 [Ganoderma leucocontextum]